MATKSFTAIVASMKAYIRSKFPSLDTSEGTLANDVVISAPGREMENIYNELSLVSDAQALLTASDQALARHAQNIGLQRKQARKARGQVTFFSNSVPVSDITIPAGTYVATFPSGNTPAIQFQTTESVVMYSAIGSSYLNPDTSVYEVTVGIESTTAGILGNVGSNNIVSLVTPIYGINGCYNNNVTSGGTDLESSDTLRSRVATHWKGTAIGSIYGYESTISEIEDVDDTLVVGGTDVERQDVGAVDVFIKGKVSLGNTDTFTTYGNTFDDLVLSRQPVVSSDSISVVSSASGSLSSSLWSLSKDTGPYGGSYLAGDKIEWAVPIGSSYGTIYVSYSYNSLVSTAQSILSQTDKNVLNTSAIVRWATELDIDITCNVAILAGYDFTNVSTTIESEIISFLGGLQLGEELQQADVARVILNTPGVDDVTLPFTTFQSSDATVIRNALGNLEIPVDSYPTAGTITINQIV